MAVTESDPDGGEMTALLIGLIALGALFATTALVTLRWVPAVLRELPPPAPPAPPCAHEWAIKLKTIEKPQLLESRWDTYHELALILEHGRGRTHAVMTCTKCGAVRITELPGTPG
jgi:hypothetical protein